MALRGEDQFYFHVTSDGSMDVYPDNKSSNFRIELKNPIDFGEADWEVALTSINYPYSWTNLGPSAGTRFKYYLDAESGEQEVKFPDWHCENMQNLIDYITAKIASKENLSTRSNRSERFRIKLDELKRIKIGTTESYYDLGFSYNMLKILGLESNPNAHNISIKAFDRRQKHRNFLDLVWMSDSMVDYRSQDLKTKFHQTADVEKLVDYIYPYIAKDSLIKVVEKEIASTKSGKLEEENEEREDNDYDDDMDDIDRSDPKEVDIDYQKDNDWIELIGKIKAVKSRQTRSSPNAVNDEVETGFQFDENQLSSLELGLARVVYHMSKLFNEKELPMSIKGIIPGNLNPVQRMFVYTDIIRPVDFNDGAIKLIRMVNTKGSAFSTTHEEFTHPTYLPLQKGKISSIHVIIADDQQTPVSFQVGTVVMTLHFRRTQNQIPVIY
jgi:hypothetical protein